MEDPARVLAALAGRSFEGMPLGAVDKRRAEFLAGRAAAVEALRALGLDAAPGRNEDGSPRWPDAAVGSISHGAGRALCAVASRAQVRSLGIDAEKLLTPDTRPELSRKICSEEELGHLALLGASEPHLVSLAFSAKESLYKCLYPLVGKFMGFEAARVVAVDSARNSQGVFGSLTLELAQEWSRRFASGGVWSPATCSLRDTSRPPCCSVSEACAPQRLADRFRPRGACVCSLRGLYESHLNKQWHDLPTIPRPERPRRDQRHARQLSPNRASGHGAGHR